MIRGNARADSRAFTFQRLRPRQPRRRGARVVPRPVAIRPALVLGETGEDEDVVPVGAERIENVGQLEIRADRTNGSWTLTGRFSSP